MPYQMAISYAMVWIRPYIVHTMGVVNRLMSNMGKENWEGVKWLLLFLKENSKVS